MITLNDETIELKTRKESGEKNDGKKEDKCQLKDFITKLDSDVSRLKSESERKDNLIKELSTYKCYEQNDDICQILDLAFKGSTTQAEQAIFHLKLNELKTELLEKRSENEKCIGNMALVKSEKQVLQEICARQKATLLSFNKDIEKLENYNLKLKSLVEEYLEIIERSKKQINFYKSELEIKEYNLRKLNEYINKEHEKNVDNNDQMEEIINSVSEGEELSGIKEASEKIKRIIIENKNLNSQLYISKAHISSILCEQSLSRDTILRLSSEVKFEKALRVGVEQKLYVLMQDLDLCKKSEDSNIEKIGCLRNQIVEMREALVKAQTEDMRKMDVISRLIEKTKLLNPITYSSNHLDLFLNKAEDILKDFDKGKKSDMVDVEWVQKCLRKLVASIKDSDKVENL